MEIAMWRERDNFGGKQVVGIGKQLGAAQCLEYRRKWRAPRYENYYIIDSREQTDKRIVDSLTYLQLLDTRSADGSRW